MIMLIGLSGYDGFAQADPSLPTFTPDGLFDKVFDQNGNQYNITDLIITNQNRSPNNILLRTVPINCNSNSIFSLFFEDGSGMEPVADPIQNGFNADRRAVACQVFQDLSDFLTNASSPLQPTSNVKVNIWVRNITNINNVAAGTLGLASSFFNMPSNATLGGIADNEIWKTIHNGVDSYTNVTAPIATTTGSSNGSGILYHGLMAFDFTNFTWNTNTSQQATAAEYDLYTVILHEVTHALGFASLIGENGLTKFNANFNYFSRYDTFLRTNNLSAPLLTTTNFNPMYNNVFNPSLNTTILHPGALPCITDTTNCLDAIQYVGTTTVPVYTPNCFSNGSSLSHFEDQLFPTCANLNNNNQYFVMSDSNGMGVTKRFLKPEERIALCDMGYAVNATYGLSGALINAGNTSYNYPSATLCSGITVAGICDGRTIDNNYQYIGNAGAPITILGSQILGNDFNAIGFTALEDMRDPTAIAITNGTNATTITFNSTIPGVHLLRYIPTNGTQQGNITYIYVFVNSTTFAINGPSCAPTPNACDLVMNGNFEQNNNFPIDFSLVNSACGWWTNNIAGADHINTLNGSHSCNFAGFQNDAIAGNSSYAGFWTYGSPTTLGANSIETIHTRLKHPLVAGEIYQLTFNVSLAEGSSGSAISTQVFLSANNVIGQQSGNYNVANGILLSNGMLTSSTSNDIWDTMSFTFTSVNGGEEFLVIGGLNNTVLGNNQAILSPIGTCTYFNYTPTISQFFSYNYIDNVSLIPTNGATFNFPATICGGTTIPDLLVLVDAVPVGGVFSGQGVLLDAITGIYSYDPSTLAAGIYAVTYSYNNSAGCPIALVRNVTVTPLATPTFTQITARCAGTTFTLPTSSTNAISGTWSPVVNNLATTTYTFTPTPGLCASTKTMTVEVITPATINGPAVICEGNIWIYTTNISGGTWSVSDPSIATIDTFSGKFTGYTSGITKVIYEIAGSICHETILEVTIIDSSVRPEFSFPTTICLGSTPPLLPTVSDNGMTGFWAPAIVDNMVSATYTFKTVAPLCDRTFTFAVSVIDPSTNPVVANLDVISQHFAFVASTTADSILNNDSIAGITLDPSVSGLFINLFDAPPGVTANIDGTLNIPPDLPVGQYIFKYQVKTDCGQSYAVVTLNITDDSGVVFDRIIKIGYCYTTTGFISNESVFDGTLVNGIRADATNATVSNLQPAVAGVSINANGNFVFAPHTVPFDYYFTCEVCPTGSSVGCATYTIARFVIEKSVFANSDEIGGRADGTFRWFNTNSITFTNSVNILLNDVYGIDCGTVGPTDHIDLSTGGNANFNNLDVAFLPPAEQYFEIDNNGNLRKKPSYLIPILDGVYYFNYRICDNQNPPICSSTTDGPFDRRCRIIIDNTGFARQAENSLIDDNSNNNLLISPNPSDKFFNFNFEHKLKNEVTITLYNLLGQILLTNKIINTDKYILDSSNFAQGQYIVKVTNGEQTDSYKIIKN